MRGGSTSGEGWLQYLWLCRFTVSTSGFSLSSDPKLFMSPFVHNSWQWLHSPHSPRVSVWLLIYPFAHHCSGQEGVEMMIQNASISATKTILLPDLHIFLWRYWSTCTDVAVGLSLVSTIFFRQAQSTNQLAAKTPHFSNGGVEHGPFRLVAQNAFKDLSEVEVEDPPDCTRCSQHTLTIQVCHSPHGLIWINTRQLSADSSAPLLTLMSWTYSRRADDMITKSFIDLQPRVSWYHTLMDILVFEQGFCYGKCRLAQKSNNKTPLGFRSSSLLMWVSSTRTIGSPGGDFQHPENCNLAYNTDDSHSHSQTQRSWEASLLSNGKNPKV